MASRTAEFSRRQSQLKQLEDIYGTHCTDATGKIRVFVPDPRTLIQSKLHRAIRTPQNEALCNKRLNMTEKLGIEHGSAEKQRITDFREPLINQKPGIGNKFKSIADMSTAPNSYLKPEGRRNAGKETAAVAPSMGEKLSAICDKMRGMIEIYKHREELLLEANQRLHQENVVLKKKLNHYM